MAKLWYLAHVEVLGNLQVGGNLGTSAMNAVNRCGQLGCHNRHGAGGKAASKGHGPSNDGHVHMCGAWRQCCKALDPRP